MSNIINYVSRGTDLKERDRDRIRQGVARVLRALEDSGSIVKTVPNDTQGSYFIYRIKTLEQKCDTTITQDVMQYATIGRPQLRPDFTHAEIARIKKRICLLGLPDPVVAFTEHRHNAGRRGIPFDLNFREWWGIWEDRYHDRGHGNDGLCMARKGDIGPYACGNVYIATNKQNRDDYFLCNRAQIKSSESRGIAP